MNNIRIIRSARRKNIVFRLMGDGSLELRIPRNFPDSAISGIISTNQVLIDKLKSKIPAKKVPLFSDGSSFFLMGKKYPLKLTRNLCLFDNAFMVPSGNHDQIRHSIVSIYRKLAYEIISERIPMWISATNCHPGKIRISSANTRWGSCSSNRTLSFSWKLIQCPLECIDYVIVHELCHLHEMNHSPYFWKAVADVIPDYQQRQQHLNKFAVQLPYWD